MAAFGRKIVLIWADVTAGYAMWVMMTYLTGVWKLQLTHAAGIINVWKGVSAILAIGMAFLADSFTGDFKMLLLSSFAYAIGLGLLSLSTPSVTGSCREYIPKCIGSTQKALFYAALVLIAVGISGYTASLVQFVRLQIARMREGAIDFCDLLGIFGVIIFAIVGGIALPYVKPWPLRFGIPAICTVIATILFLTGSHHYEHEEHPGSPLTTIIRVFVASASKVFHRSPTDSNDLYEIQQEGLESLPHTEGLRCLDKAAIGLPTQEEHRWKLCRVTEVEETKIVVRFIPMLVTLVICSIVSSIGDTYFVEQAKHLNPKVGHLKVPLQLLKLISSVTKELLVCLNSEVAESLFRQGSTKIRALFGIMVAMVFAVLCCITAARVETRRLDVVASHGLVDKPDETIPMTMFWLVPQFILLSGLDGILSENLRTLFGCVAPLSMSGYLLHFVNGVMGFGRLASVLSVYIVEKVRGGKLQWFEATLNKSRLDNYYWTLGALSAVNLVIYVLVASLYSFTELSVQESVV